MLLSSAAAPSYTCRSKDDLDAALAAAYSSRDAAAQAETRDKAARARGELTAAQKEVRGPAAVLGGHAVLLRWSAVLGGPHGDCWCCVWCAASGLQDGPTCRLAEGPASLDAVCAVHGGSCDRYHLSPPGITSALQSPVLPQVEAAKSERERKAAQRKADQAKQRVQKYEQRLQEAASNQVG